MAWWLLDDTEEQRTKQLLEVERERTAFLAHASNLLLSSMNLGRCMEITAQLASEYLADAAVVILPPKVNNLTMVWHERGSRRRRPWAPSSACCPQCRPRQPRTRPGRGLPMTHGLTTSVSVRDAHTVRIRLGGELTFENAEELDVVLSQHLLEFPDVQDVVLDCTDITAVDSIGLSTLLMAKRRAHQANARLHLDNRPPRLERMLTSPEHTRTSPKVSRGPRPC